MNYLNFLSLFFTFFGWSTTPFIFLISFFFLADAQRGFYNNVHDNNFQNRRVGRFLSDRRRVINLKWGFHLEWWGRFIAVLFSNVRETSRLQKCKLYHRGRKLFAPQGNKKDVCKQVSTRRVFLRRKGLFISHEHKQAQPNHLLLLVLSVSVSIVKRELLWMMTDTFCR